MGMPTKEDLLDTVWRFYLRARRVTEHTLFDEEDALSAVADGGWWAKQTDGQVTLYQSFPAEERLESLAARVRPLVLNDDPVYFEKALNAVSALLHLGGHIQHLPWCKHLKAEWKSVNPKTGKAGYFVSWSTENDTEPPHEITDAALALTWFYGDFIHADSAQQDAGEKFGLTHRYGAAAVRTAQIAILARDTLSYLRFLVEDGALDLDLTTLDSEPVRVTNAEFSGTVMTAPVGTEAAPAGQPQNPLFQQLTGPWLGAEDGTRRMIIPWGSEA